MNQAEIKSSLSLQGAGVINKVVFVGLLLVMVLTAIPYGTVDPWWEALFECSVFALTALWVLEVLLRGSWQIKGLTLILPLILLTAFAYLQTVALPVQWLPMGAGRLSSQHTLTIDRYQTYLTATKIMALTLFLGLLLNHVTTAKRLWWLVSVVIGLGSGSALFGLVRQFLQSPDSPNGFLLPFLFYGIGYGQFISPNTFAYMMEMPFGLVLGLVLGGGVRRDRIPIYLAMVAFIWTALVLSNSRGGIVSLTVQSILLVYVSLGWYSRRLLARRNSGQRTWLNVIHGSLLVRLVVVGLMAGTLTVGVLWVGGDALGGKLAQRESDSSEKSVPDSKTRGEIWRSSWAVVKHNRWTGVGFGAYYLAIPQYENSSGRVRLEQAHNDYLDLAANGGIVAVALGVWFLAMAVWKSRSSFGSDDPYRRAAAFGAGVGLVGVLVHSSVEFGLQLTGIATIFAALVVILVADRRVESAARAKS